MGYAVHGRYNIDILGVGECRLPKVGKTKLTSRETILYSGRNDWNNRNGVAKICNKVPGRMDPCKWPHNNSTILVKVHQNNSDTSIFCHCLSYLCVLLYVILLLHELSTFFFVSFPIVIFKIPHILSPIWFILFITWNFGLNDISVLHLVDI